MNITVKFLTKHTYCLYTICINVFVLETYLQIVHLEFKIVLENYQKSQNGCSVLIFLSLKA